MRGRLRPLLLLLLLALPACVASDLPLEALPSQPIAFTYWTAEETRRRAEAVADLAGRRQGDPERPDPRRSRRGIMPLDELTELPPPEVAARLDRYPGRLVLLDPRTGTMQRLEAALPGARPLGWSADRSRLLFTGPLRGRSQIFEYRLETDEVRRVTRGPAEHPAGILGPGGRVAIFRTSDGDRGALLATPAGGGPPRPLVDDVRARALAWSPDGETLVYERAQDGRGGREDRWLVARSDQPGGEERALAPGLAPVYTPDGEWIVFTAPARRGFQLMRMRPDGTGRTAITAHTSVEHSPAVSPDGSYVAYVASDGIFNRLFVRRFDGSGAPRVLVEDGTVLNPVW